MRQRPQRRTKQGKTNNLSRNGWNRTKHNIQQSIADSFHIQTVWIKATKGADHVQHGRKHQVEQLDHFGQARQLGLVRRFGQLGRFGRNVHRAQVRLLGQLGQVVRIWLKSDESPISPISGRKGAKWKYWVFTAHRTISTFWSMRTKADFQG